MLDIEKSLAFMLEIVVQGSLNRIKGNKKLIHNIIRLMKLFQADFLFHDFNEYNISHIVVNMIQKIISRVAFVLVIITADVKMLNFLTNHITMKPSHRVHKGENRNHINNNPNNAKSTNAVIFARAAKPKIIHVIMRYFNKFILSLFILSLFCINISQANRASKHRAITHKSVLLSTITRNAHIQLVSRKINKNRHIVIHFAFSMFSMLIVVSFFHFFSLEVFLSSLFSDFFLLSVNVNIWNTIAIPKISTNIELKLFIEMAMLSGESPSHQFVHQVKEKIKVKNKCQIHGILFHIVFHR